VPRCTSWSKQTCCNEPLAEPQHIVVDGSNLATEGRTLPSLAQLDEAVRTFADEHPGAAITVVVDASFEHRIDESERETVREAMLNGELVSPPAGAIGRGDAFVLRIAERTGAMVLSNDSFQEFHGEHPWLFDDGRLIGGKPVPGVGWIFTPRLPIRGPKSRAATELAKATKKEGKKGGRRSSAKDSALASATWPLTPTSPPPARLADPVMSSAIEEAVAEALDPTAPVKKKAASKTAAAKKSEPGSKKAAAKKATGTKKAAAQTKSEAPAKKATGTKKAAQAKTEAPAKKAAGTKKAASKAAQGKSAPDKAGQGKAVASAEPSSSRQSPLPAVNEPLAFINFVAAHKVGSTIEGTVVSFTSHGAMVDVLVPDGVALHCYIPLSAMGDPPPTKAREVLKKGEMRPFVLAGLDPPRRVAELALPAPLAKKRRAPAKKAAKASSSR
jgi:hypothetical protein